MDDQGSAMPDHQSKESKQTICKVANRPLIWHGLWLLASGNASGLYKQLIASKTWCILLKPSYP